jgi:hypothetical protein
MIKYRNKKYLFKWERLSDITYSNDNTVYIVIHKSRPTGSISITPNGTVSVEPMTSTYFRSRP